jgi:hypothetical protein
MQACELIVELPIVRVLCETLFQIGEETGEANFSVSGIACILGSFRQKAKQNGGDVKRLGASVHEL